MHLSLLPLKPLLSHQRSLITALRALPKTSSNSHSALYWTHKVLCCSKMYSVPECPVPECVLMLIIAAPAGFIIMINNWSRICGVILCKECNQLHVALHGHDMLV